jgi:hypothetical protein
MTSFSSVRSETTSDSFPEPVLSNFAKKWRDAKAFVIMMLECVRWLPFAIFNVNSRVLLLLVVEEREKKKRRKKN